MRGNRTPFVAICVAYALGAILLVSFGAKRMLGQQPVEGRVAVPPIPQVVVPALGPVIHPIPATVDFNDDHWRYFNMLDEEDSQKSFPLPAGQRSREIDNI